MKNSIKILAALAILGFAGTASAQNSSTANGYAQGRIISPINIAPSREGSGGIGFGNIVNGNGTVTESGGADVYNNLAMTPGLQLDGPHDASFTVTGQPGFTFAYSTAINGGGALGTGLTLLAVTPASGNGTLTGGNAVLTFGGTVGDDGTAATGVFNVAGAFTVSVNYN